MVAQDSVVTVTSMNDGIAPYLTNRPDTAVVPRGRIWAVSGIHVGVYTASLVILNEAWFAGYPQRTFHSFDDSKEWQQVDKIGHGWSSYNLSRISAMSWKWAGMSDKKAALVGSASGFGFLTVIEILDARSSKWGWSWSDIAANTLGTGLYLSQELAWKEQRIQLKFSFHPKSYEEQMLIDRTDDLYGSVWYEQMLKDYNSQTYWLSANLKSFFRQSKIPAWLNVSFGYGADGMYGGFDNTAKDEYGNVTFDRRDIPRVRQFYLAPDVDLTKIRTNKKWLRTTLFLLNAFKFPAPALMIDTRGQVRFHPIYF